MSTCTRFRCKIQLNLYLYLASSNEMASCINGLPHFLAVDLSIHIIKAGPFLVIGVSDKVFISSPEPKAPGELIVS